MATYYSVLIPYAKHGATQWHPTTSKGPFRVLSRGAFRTRAEAAAWAQSHLGHTRWSIKKHDDGTGRQRRNRSGDSNMSGGAKRTKRASKDPKVSAGRVHADRFYDYDELPKAEQRTHDWAAENGDQFVRMYYGKRGKGRGRYEYIPLENFQRVNGAAPSGRPADGFAPDSYFSGIAIKMIPQRSGSDHDYQVWMESW